MSPDHWRLDSFLLAEAAALQENRVFIHGGGMTRFEVPAVPWVQPQLSIFARFRGEGVNLQGQHLASVQLIDPAGTDVLPETPLPFAARKVTEHLEEEEIYLDLVVTLGPLPIQGEGVYSLELRFDEHLVREMKLPVRVVEPPAGSGWAEVPFAEGWGEDG